MGFYDAIVDEKGDFKVYQGGEWRVSASGKTLDISNPSKGGTAYRAQGAHLDHCADLQPCIVLES